MAALPPALFAAGRALGLRAATILINLAYVPIVAALLGAGDYGLISSAIGKVLIFLVLSYAGANWRLAVEIGRAPHDEARLVGQYLAARWVTAPAAALCCVLAYALLQPDARILPLIAILSLAIVPRSIASLRFAVYYGRGDARRALGFELVARAAEVTLVLAGIALFGLGVGWIALASLLTWSAVALWLHRQGDTSGERSPLWPSALAVVRAGLPYAALGGAAMAATQLAIVAAPLEIEPRAALGWLALAVNGAVIATALAQSMIATMTPRIAQSAEQGSALERRVFANGTGAALVAALAVACALRWLGEPVLVPLLGESYAGMVGLAGPIGILVGALLSLSIAITMIGFHRHLWSSAAIVGGATLVVLVALDGVPGASAGRILASASAAALIAAFAISVLFARDRGAIVGDTARIWAMPLAGAGVLALAAVAAVPAGAVQLAVGLAGILWLGWTNRPASSTRPTSA